MIVACSSCQTRFEAAGYRDAHCPACGAIAQQAGARPCPRCELPLGARQISDLVIDECSRCGGVFVDHVAVDLVVSDHEHERAEALLAALRHAPHSPLPPAGGKMYVKCPTCSVTMNRRQSASGARVVVDVCKAHGTFFDPGELPAIIAFVKGGGAPKPQPTEKKSQPASSGTGASDIADTGSALVDLFLTLFD